MDSINFNELVHGDSSDIKRTLLKDMFPDKTEKDRLEMMEKMSSQTFATVAKEKEKKMPSHQITNIRTFVNKMKSRGWNNMFIEREVKRRYGITVYEADQLK